MDHTFIQSDIPQNGPFSQAELHALHDLSSGQFCASCCDVAVYRWSPHMVKQDCAAAFLVHFGVAEYDRHNDVYLLTEQGIERAQVTALVGLRLSWQQ